MSATPEATIKVLMIDDDADDALLIGKLLGGVYATRYKFEWARTFLEGMERLCANEHDVCLLDFQLGAHNGLELLDEARKCGSRVPIIMLTGLGADEIDRAAMAAGALDYLSKGELTSSSLERSIRYGLQQAKTLRALTEAHDELEQKIKIRTADLAASEEALREANQRLKEADKRKDDFLAMLAHELRNPLAPIRNAVHILSTYCDASCSGNEVTLRQRDMIERQVAHMSRLLDDLLDVSRITRGKFQLKRETVDLRQLAEQAIENMRSQIDSRCLRLEFQTAAKPLPVNGDPTRLDQVFRNLLHNASKYTAPGGHIWVTVEAADMDGNNQEAIVRVRDSGEGIAPELLEHIFEPFVQAEQSLARTQGGLGIGLSMVKSIAEMHGGRVEAHSAGRGQGSEFVIHLPVVAPAEKAPEPALRSAPPGREGNAGDSKRALVVDDNEDAAVSLSDLLEIWGYEVRFTFDGREALAVAREWRPQIILLDIGLPGMNGYEIAGYLRRDSATEKAFIVALTGYGAEEDRQRALEAGFDCHLTKPVELSRLEALLRDARAA